MANFFSRFRSLRDELEIKKAIFWMTAVFSILIYGYDLLPNSFSEFQPVLLNSLSIVFILLVVVCYLLGWINIEWGFAAFAYSIMANSIIDVAHYVNSDWLLYHYFRNTFFLIIVVGLISYTSHYRNALVFGGIHLVFSLIVTFSQTDPVATSNIPVVMVVYVSFCICTYFFIKALKEYTIRLQELHQQVETKNQSITQQNEELQAQQENLQDANAKLVEQHTELSEQRNELEKVNATKDKFISILAHDLRNPFNYLVNISELFLFNYNKLDDERKLQYVKTFHDTSKTTYNLLEKILYWARSQTGKLKINKTDFDLIELFFETQEIYSESVNDKKIQTSLPEEKSLYIHSDRDMLYTVLRNLYSNALKYTPENGRIDIELSKNETQVLFSVSDTGSGIDDAIKKNLFKHTVSESTPGLNGEKGTGLGLVLCKELVEKLDGTITVDSQPEKGSRFTVSLPI